MMLTDFEVSHGDMVALVVIDNSEDAGGRFSITFCEFTQDGNV